MLNLKFKSTEHEEAFFKALTDYNVRPGDKDRIALFYTLTISKDCRKHLDDLYDINEECVKPEGIDCPWVTHTDARAIRLAFNLFNWGVPTSRVENQDACDNLYDIRGNFVANRFELIRSTPIWIFDNQEYGEFFIQAVRLRCDLLN